MAQTPFLLIYLTFKQLALEEGDVRRKEVVGGTITCFNIVFQTNGTVVVFEI